MRVPLTQKARGVCAMKLYAPWHRMVPEFKLIQSHEDVEAYKWEFHPTFARFCPPVPEHGYIESRDVASKEELHAALDETLKRHPKSEIMLMKRMDAYITGSFVWTPSLVTVGEGHEGATAGKDGCIKLPLVPVKLPKEVTDAAGVPDGSTPYIEGLIGPQLWGGVNLVQLRHGPEPPASLDYVPKAVRVKRVVKAEGDLLQFAELVKELGDGDVVDHFGGSLTSHFGVHCLSNKIPIVTTFKPEVGMRLSEVVPKLAPHNPKAVVDWFLYGMRDAVSRNWGMAEMGHACNAALFLVHNAAALGDRPDLLGLALSILVKLCVIACHGEARHIGSDEHAGNSRVYVFKQGLKGSFKAIEKLPAKREAFEAMGSFHTGVGGQMWAQCANVTIELIEALRELAGEASQEKLAAVLTAANVAVNEAHNGGWWLNKFTNEKVFDDCSEGQPYAVAHALPGLRGLEVTLKNVNNKTWGRIVGFNRKKFLAQPAAERRGLKLMGVQHTFVVDPLLGDMYVMGRRIGWKMNASDELIEAVLKGKILPVLDRRGLSYGGPVGVGSVLKLRAKDSWSGLNGDGKAFDVIIERFEQFDSYTATDRINDRNLGSLLHGHGSPINGGPKMFVCEKCLQVKRPLNPSDTLPFFCSACGGIEDEVPMCHECGAEARLMMKADDGGSYRKVCWKCAWKMLHKHNEVLLENEMAPKKAKKEKKNIKMVMCAGPSCSITKQSSGMYSPAAFTCGCMGFTGTKLQEGMVALTLETLKGLTHSE